MKPIVFVGFMGAGKSTASKQLGKALGLEVIDVDSEFTEETGESIEQFFDEQGEEEFRKIEERLTLDAIKPGRVVATGGGAVLSTKVREAVSNSLCIFLDTPEKIAWKRIEGGGRPLARDREQFSQLHSERQKLYECVAQVTIPSQASGAIQKMQTLIERLAKGELKESTKVAWAVTGSGEYPAMVAEGLLGEIGKVWRHGRAFIVADSNTAPLYLEQLSGQIDNDVAGTFVIEAGGEQKTLSQAESVLREMARSQLDRSDCVVALGGGVVGDLAGFCASTYQRGIDVVQIPTTLVAQVDSAYGGKTGVDLPEAKNYVGTFHQPVAVYVDPGLLKTLPEEELSAGFAEVAKTALIEGGSLWERVKNSEKLEELVFDCLRVKLEVVRRDEMDVGVRAVLNLGHTVGHAIEAATGYKKYRHGEAVAIGLCAALELSERKLGLDSGVRSHLVELFEKRRLPVDCREVSGDDLVERISYDKKRREGASNWVLLAAPGDVRTHQEVDEADVREVVDGLVGGGSG